MGNACSNATCTGSSWVTLASSGNEVPIPYQPVPGGIDFVLDLPGGPCAQIVYYGVDDRLGLQSADCEASVGFPICQRFVV